MTPRWSEAAGVWIRTVRSLHPLQLLARPVRLATCRLVRDVPSAVPPELVRPTHGPSDELRQLLRHDAIRALERLERLPTSTLLRRYEEAYGFDVVYDALNLNRSSCQLSGKRPGPVCNWSDPVAVHPYPASVRARNLALGIWLGKQGLQGQLARACRAVMVQPEVHLLGNHLLENGLGLVCAAAVARGPEAEAWYAAGTATLAWQLPQQFLSDGGHFERSASYHLWLTVALLQAVALARASGRSVPQLWEDTARGALAWIARVRAPDGTYPLFNDASFDAAPAPDDVLLVGKSMRLWDGVKSNRLGIGFDHLPDTGWVMAWADDGLIALDAGADGAPYQPGHVHADALTFELWVAGQRVVVDYGVGSYADDEERKSTRATCSHNTVEVEGTNSSEVWSAFRVGRRCRAELVRAQLAGSALELEAMHDGYKWLPGRPVHRRRLRLSPGQLRIIDTVEGRASRAVVRLRTAEMTASSLTITSRGDKGRTVGATWNPVWGGHEPARVTEWELADGRVEVELGWGGT